MLSGLSTTVLIPIVPNRHQKDRLLITSRNSNQTPLIIIGAPGVAGTLTQWQTSTGVIGARVTSLGDFSNQNGGGSSEKFGASATVAGNNSLAVGNSASCAGADCVSLGTSVTCAGNFSISIGYIAACAGASSVSLGEAASCAVANSVAIGASAAVTSTLGTVAIGYQSTSSGGSAVAIGYQTTANGAAGIVIGAGSSCSNSSSIVLGASIGSSANNQFIVGPITTIVFGNGSTSSSASNVAMRLTNGNGADNPGATFRIAPGQSTGAGAPATLIFQGSVATGSSSTVQSLVDIVTVGGATQNVLIQTTAATVIGHVIKLTASQTGDALEVQKSDGTVYYTLDKLARPVTSNTTPTIAAGTGAGTSPTISITGTDVNGVITLTSGTLPTGAAVVATITFSSAFGSTPKTVMLTPANSNAAALNALTMVWVNSAGLTTTTWTINAGASGLGAATAYIWYYQVLG